MKITKKLLAACVAALALSMPLMGCNGGNTAKPVGSAAGSASKQTTEKKESNKPADDRIELPPPRGESDFFFAYIPHFPSYGTESAPDSEPPTRMGSFSRC